MDNKINKPTYDELEAQVKQLAAESLTARNAVQVFCDVVGANTDAICEEVGPDGVKAILAAMSATGNMPATDSYLSQLRNEARAEGVEMLVERRLVAARLAKEAGNEKVAQEMEGEAIRARFFAKELREGKASPQSSAIEFPKNNSSSNGWTIDPQFLSRVSDRAEAVYGYRPGLEETEAALLAGLDLLREGKAGEVQS